MSMQFAERLKNLRIARGLSQKELAKLLYVTRSAVARWESGSRLPDAGMIPLIAQVLEVDPNSLFSTPSVDEESLNVIMIDDRKVILSGGLPVLEAVLPQATITGFTRPSEAIEYAKEHAVSLAFVDIELGKLSGLDLCRTLLELNPRTNVVFLTAYEEYAFDAWNTGASGFMLKPITREGVRAQLKNLRHPIALGGAE